MNITKIGFAGFGNMGTALFRGFLKSGVIPASDVAVLSRGARGKEYAEKSGAVLCKTPAELAAFADIVILAVKPKDAPELISALCPAIGGKALLSVVAGLSSDAVRERLWGTKARVLVTLPNTPVAVGEGIVGLASETDFSQEEKKFIENLFSKTAMVEWLPENKLGALSALSGSGPAFAAIAAEALADGAVAEGLPRAVAGRLAAQTLAGTGRLLLEQGGAPGAVKDAVCSPGGTTVEGVAVLEEYRFRAALINAVRAASQKFYRLLPK